MTETGWEPIPYLSDSNRMSPAAHRVAARVTRPISERAMNRSEALSWRW